MIEAMLPRATDSEAYIVGCLVRFHSDRDAVEDIFTRLTATDFLDSAHAKIFAAAQRQYGAGGIDPVLLGKETGLTDVLVEVGLDPCKAPATCAHIPTQADRIVEMRRKRQLAAISESAREGALNGQAFDDTLRSLTADLDDLQRENRQGITLRKASTIEQRAVDWAWPGWLHKGGLTLIDGDPEKGKSQIAVDVVSRWTYPRPFPFTMCDHFREPSNALIVASEDGAETTTVPRLNAAGANLDRVLIWPEDAEPISLPSGIDRLKAAVTQHEIGLLILDPITAYLDEEINANRDADVRRALRPLITMAQETNLAIIGIRHLNKDSGKAALYRGGGSIGFTALARVVWAVGHDPNDPTKFVLGVLKSNIAKKPPSLSYTIESRETTSRIHWEGESTWTANDILGQHRGRGAKGDDAEAFIRELLANGPMPAAEVEDRCTEAGIKAWTYRQARKRMGITSTKGSMREGWLLALPEDDGFESGSPEDDGFA